MEEDGTLREWLRDRNEREEKHRQVIYEMVTGDMAERRKKMNELLQLSTFAFFELRRQQVKHNKSVEEANKK